MATHFNADPETFRYVIKDPVRLTERQRQDISNAVFASMRADFPGLEDKHYLHALTHVGKVGVDPNSATGGPLLEKNHSYTDNLNILAVRDDMVHAVLTIANNATSTCPGPFGFIQKKLKLSRFGSTDHKSRWIGHRSMIPELRPAVAKQHEEGRFAVTDALGLIALAVGDFEQPVAVNPHIKAHPYNGEELWQETLSSWDLAADEGYGDNGVRLRWIFGIETAPVSQARMTNGHAHKVGEAIQKKDGGFGFLGSADIQIDA